MFILRHVDDGHRVTNHFAYKNNIPFSSSRLRQLAKGTTKQTNERLNFFLTNFVIK